MTNTTLQSRIERFASLQAAQRSLGHSADLSELADLRTRGRKLLISLRQISSDIERDAGLDPNALANIDRTLDQQASRTRAILNEIGLAQLRASIPSLAEKHPRDVQGLLDLALTGDLHDEKNLRIIEYLITVLSTEEWEGQRKLVVNPSEVSEVSARITSERMESSELDYLAAERVFEEAATRIIANEGLGDIRDRVRHYKEQLGPGLLHPRVLRPLVAYNVAMWNRVSSEIESSREIDQLADGLLAPQPIAELATVEPGEHCGQILESKAFERLLSAFHARVAKQPCGDPEANWILDALEIASLGPDDVALFASPEADQATSLMRSAVLVGLLLSRRAALEDALEVMEIDAETLATETLDELITEVSQAARRLFAEGNSGTAFRMSEIKTQRLLPHATGGRASTVILSVPQDTTSGVGYRIRQILQDLPTWPSLLAISLVVCIFAVPTLVGRTAEDIAKRDELHQISPFIERGRSMGEGPDRLFAGSLARTWDYVDTDERRRIAGEVGYHFSQQGIPRVVLKDVHRNVVVEYRHDRIELLTPRDYGSTEPDTEPGGSNR